MAFLIETKDELKRHNSSITEDMDPESLRSFLDDADLEFIIPAIDRATFNMLVAGKATFADADPKKTAVTLLQKAAVNFALGNYVNSGAVSITNAGISVIKNSTRMPASDKKLVALRADCFEAAYSALEKAIDFLEQNLLTFTDYATSSAHQNNRALFINSSADFQAAGVNINKSAQLYQTIRTHQIEVELDKIEPILGNTITSTLRAAILSGSSTNEQKTLIKKIQYPIAFFSLAYALTYLMVSVRPNGVFQVNSSVGGISGNTEITSPATETTIGLIKAKLMSSAENHLHNLREFLSANATTYGYTKPVPVVFNDDASSNIYTNF